jgi:hypothetical protein
MLWTACGVDFGADAVLQVDGLCGLVSIVDRSIFTSCSRPVINRLITRG